MRTRRTTLDFVPMSIGWRLIGGALLGACWTVCAMVPVIRATESDVPQGLLLGIACMVALTPALLAARRHSLAATLVWDDEAITHYLGTRVKTAIAWKDARVLVKKTRSSPRVLQIVDGEGRTISLADGHGIAPAWLHGRRKIRRGVAEELLALASRLGRPIVEGVAPELDDGPPLTRDWARLGLLGLALAVATASWVRPAHALWTMLVCGALLVVPLRRFVRSLRRGRAVDWLAFDGAETGLVRAHRVDGVELLVDVGPAHHVDALVGTRPGFVAAALQERRERPSIPYRASVPVLDAVEIETQADRALRSDRMRAAFIDLFAYGGLFATAVAAVLVS